MHTIAFFSRTPQLDQRKQVSDQQAATLNRVRRYYRPSVQTVAPSRAPCKAAVPLGSRLHVVGDIVKRPDGRLARVTKVTDTSITTRSLSPCLIST